MVPAMTGGLVVLTVSILLAMMARRFWREIAAAAVIVVLAVIFVGILTLVVQVQSVMHGS
jgi:hypothetical protein